MERKKDCDAFITTNVASVGDLYIKCKYSGGVPENCSQYFFYMLGHLKRCQVTKYYFITVLK